MPSDEQARLKPGDNPDTFSTGLFIAGAAWAGIAALFVVAYTQVSWSKIALAGLVTFGACAIGAVVGFLFGVPKARSDTDGARLLADGSYKPNTNLEQVSDWLTKIIIGVGLVQIRQISAGIAFVGQEVGAAIGDLPGAPGSGTVVAIGLLVGSAAITFLLMYMWTCTRLYAVFSGQGKDGPSTTRS